MNAFIKRIISIILVITLTSNIVLQSAASGAGQSSNIEAQDTESVEQDASSGEKLSDVEDKTFTSASENSDSEEEPVEVLFEIKELRDQCSKQFRLSDGSVALAEYNMDIHYVDESGCWEEIDNRFIFETADSNNDIDGYATAVGSTEFKFAPDVADGDVVQVSQENYSIGMQLMLPESNSTDRLSTNNQTGNPVPGSVAAIQSSDITIIKGDVLNPAYAEEILSLREAKENQEEAVSTAVPEVDMSADEAVFDYSNEIEITEPSYASGIDEDTEFLEDTANIETAASSENFEGEGSAVGESPNIGEEYEVSGTMKPSEYDSMIDSTDAIAPNVTDEALSADVIWASVDSMELSDNPEISEPLCTQMEVENAVTSVGYGNVLPGISLQYVAYGSSLKEYILVNQQYDNYQYSFALTIDGLYAEMQEDGSILLKDNLSNEAVYEIPCSYMEDAAGACSTAVSTDLKQTVSGQYILTITADPSWINDAARVFPVQIDPSLNKLITSLNNIRGIYTSSWKPTVSTVDTGAMFIGYDSSECGKMRTYIQLRNLPALPADSVICGAYFYTYVRSYSSCEMSSLIINAKEVTSTSAWTDTYTWNASPAVSSLITDYQTITSGKVGSYVGWNITSLLKEKYELHETSSITTFELSAKLESSMRNTYAANTSLRLTATSAYPILQVLYRDTKGIEDYFTYQTQSIGYAGTGYVGDYTSQLTILEDDVSYESTALSYALRHVYNSAYGNANFTSSGNIYTGNYTTMKLGAGWKLSAQETVTSISITNLNSTSTYLVYNDSDGTEHYFKLKSGSSSTYEDEDGLNLTITRSGSTYTMTDKGGNKKTFKNGYLTTITDANGNQIHIIYNGGTYSSNTPSTSSGNHITSIAALPKGASSATTIATLTYNSYNQLSSITDYDNRIVSYTYSGTGETAKLTKITRYGTDIAQYQYDSTSNRLNHAFDLVTLTGMQYDYTASATGYVISSFHEYASSTISGTQTTGQSVKCTNTDLLRKVYTDSGADRTFNTSDDITTACLFNNCAQTINVSSSDSSGNLLGVTATAYTTTSGTSKTNNRISGTVSSGQAGINLLSNGSFESYSGTTATGWTHDTSNGGAIAARSGTAHSGNMRYNLYAGSLSLSPAIYQSVSLTAGKNYTLSAYVNTCADVGTIGTGGGAYLKVTTSSGKVIATSDILSYKTSSNIDNGWQRIFLTFEPSSTASYRLYLVWSNATGTLYADDIQLEVGEAASSFNLISNGSFESGSTNWTLSGSATDVSTAAYKHGAKSIKITGDSTSLYQIHQTVNINKSGSTSFMLSAWSKANSVPDLSQTKYWDDARYWGLVIQLNYSDGTNETAQLTFRESITGWQYNSIPVVPKYPDKTISTATVFCCYYNEANTAYFDNISLVEEPAQTYTYDDNGNLTAVNSSGNGDVEYTYSSTTQNLLSVATEGSGTYTYSYNNTDNTHLVTNVANDTVAMCIKYDNQGEATQTRLTNDTDSSYMTSSAAYENGLLTSVTDNTGRTTTYFYPVNTSTNSKSRLLASTQNANGATIVTTSYNFMELPCLVYQSKLIALNYTYSNGLLTQINRGGYLTEGGTGDYHQYYNFTYNSFGNRTGVSVGSQTLATYSYASGNGNLSCMTYGNGDSVSYTYDNLDRVSSMSYNNSGTESTYTYCYDGNSNLSSVTDISTGKVYNYTYDSLGRLIYSNLSNDGFISLYTSHKYDTSNRITAQNWQIGSDSFSEAYTYNSEDGTLTSMTAGGTLLSFGYDSLKRLSKTSTSLYDVGYTYRTISGNQTTSQVSQITYKKPGSTTALLAALSYTYDSMGNITQVKSGSSAPTTYTYDSQNQLVTAVDYSQATALAFSYTYDTMGNIREAKLSNGMGLSQYSYTHDYKYDNSEWLDQLTSFDGHPITYDSIGNPLSYYNGSRWDFTWKNGRQLVTASKSGTSITNTYDANGIRDSKTVNSVVHDYTILSGLIVRETYGNVVIDYAYDNNGRPFSITVNNNGTKYTGYYLLNLQGDVIAILNSSGAVAVEYDYTPYGAILHYNASGTTGSILYQYNALLYRGYYYDADLGMYYLQSRFYDPEVCRFINADAADYAELAAVNLSSTNLFAYCENNPVVYNDTAGNFLTTAIIGEAVLGAAINLTTSYIAAKVTGQEFTIADAGFAIAAGALTAVSAGYVKLVGAVVSGAYTSWSLSKSGVSLRAATVCGAINAVCTISSIGNLSYLLKASFDWHAAALADFVIAVGNNCTSAAANCLAKSKYTTTPKSTGTASNSGFSASQNSSHSHSFSRSAQQRHYYNDLKCSNI